MLLADQKPSNSSTDGGHNMQAVLRMARLYYDRYPRTLNWQNLHGKTALHFAAQKGNEELVRVHAAACVLVPRSLRTSDVL